MASQQPSAESPASHALLRAVRRVARAARCAARGVAALAGAYLAFVLVGLAPVNNRFSEPADGVTIYLVSTAVHADVVMPLANEVVDWREHFPARCFRASTAWATHVSVGWGDQGFFLETPAWSDLRLTTALKALFWPSASCLHVSCTAPQYLVAGTRPIRLTHDQYRRLAEFVRESFDARGPLETARMPGKAYGAYDAFFRARGAYHCLNTCNSWVGEGMAIAGVRVPWKTPLPKTVFLYLPSAPPAASGGERP